jgi:hypothetical protein
MIFSVKELSSDNLSDEHRNDTGSDNSVSGREASDASRFSRSASVRFYATPADTEAQTQARSIAASLLEQSKQIFCIPEWGARVRPLPHQDSSRRRKRPQRNTGVRSCELEGVL